MNQPLARILIVVRRDMDLDNLAPVAWHLAMSQRAEVMVLSTNSKLSAKTDPRLNFLAHDAGVKTGNFYRVFTTTWRHKLVAKLISEGGRQPKGWRARVIQELTRGGLNRLYDEVWCEDLLKHFGITHIVMDWAKESSGSCGALTRAGKRLSIPSFALPHGIDVWNSPDYYLAPLRQAGFFRHFDFIITPNDIRRNFLAEGGFPIKRIAVLGSARFCPTWERILTKIVEADSDALPKDGGLNVVWFDKIGATCPPSELSALLNRIAALPFVRLAVKNKPHAAISYEPSSLSTDIIDGSAIPSFALCQWASVLAGLPSGILLDAFVLNKELVLMDGLDGSGACEPYRTPPVCWLARDGDEFVEALTIIKDQSPERPYKAQDVTQFIEQVLFPNGSRTAVLENYSNFIIGAAPLPAVRVLNE